MDKDRKYTRVLGGAYKATKLYARDCKPTMGIVKKRLFDWIYNLIGDITNLKCLDLFAGSGALGFECISRGADAIFVDNNKQCIHSIKENGKKLKQPFSIIYEENALHFLEICNLKFDIIFLDPPYKSDILQDILLKLDNIVHKNTIIYLEYHYKTKLVLENYKILKTSTTSNTTHTLIQQSFD